jgi:hypothetical protein
LCCGWRRDNQTVHAVPFYMLRSIASVVGEEPLNVVVPSVEVL